MKPVTRRDCLKYIAAAGAMLHMPRPAFAAQAQIASLRELAAMKGIIYGSDSDESFAKAPEEYRALFLRQCALYAPNISWAHVNRGPGLYDFRRDQADLDFAVKNNLKLTGAHLLWHERTPDWFTKITDTGQAEKAIADHINFMMSRFKGQVYSWNVINEALHPAEGRADGLRNGPVKPEYFELAFNTARAADPAALLVYNDYGMELRNAEHEAKRGALLRLLDRLQKNNAPIQAVGLQSHLRVKGFQFDDGLYRKFLHEIASRGLKILITELDVMDEGAPAETETRDQIVAAVYARYLNVVLDEPQVCAVLTWGLSDRYTWLTPETGEHFSRSDHLPTRPLPFDADFRAKPAFTAIAQAFSNAPARKA